MYIDELLESLHVQMEGVVAILDYKGFGFDHARNIGTSRLKNISQLIQVSKIFQKYVH